jgi:hypothetical protein
MWDNTAQKCVVRKFLPSHMALRHASSLLSLLLEQRLLEYEYLTNYKQNNTKCTLFQTLVILQYSPKHLTQKFILRMLEKQIISGFFLQNFCQLCWGDLVCDDVIFF